VPINTGCLNRCTYCKTKHARGDLGRWVAIADLALRASISVVVPFSLSLCHSPTFPFHLQPTLKCFTCPLRSYPPEEIVERIQQVIADGVVEIWLTSEVRAHMPLSFLSSAFTFSLSHLLIIHLHVLPVSPASIPLPFHISRIRAPTAETLALGCQICSGRLSTCCQRASCCGWA
jgi:hypothetical protein